MVSVENSNSFPRKKGSNIGSRHAIFPPENLVFAFADAVVFISNCNITCNVTQY